MNCVEWEERIALYAGGDLPAAEALEVDRHVADCAECQALLSGLRASLALARDAHGEPVEAAHFAAVRARVLSEIERGSVRRWRFAWVYAMAAAAIVVSIALWPRTELRMAVPMPQAPAPPAVALVAPPPRPLREIARKPAPPAQEAAEPMVVKLLTDDPDVIIYWITGTKGE